METITKEEYLKLQEELASARQNNAIRKQGKQLNSIKQTKVKSKPKQNLLTTFLNWQF